MLQEPVSTDSTPGGNNCTTTDNFLTLRPRNEIREDEMDTVAADVLADDTRNNSNVSHPRTLTSPKDWDEKPKLKFPKFATEERYRMASLHLDKGWFAFDFLRSFLSFVQPYNISTDLLVDAVENRISTTELISESMHVEAAFLSLVGVCCVLACIIPGTELWLACRPIREDYKPTRHPGILAFLLGVLAFILGSCMPTMIICNEAVATGIGKLPVTVETALQDLKDYHADTTSQLRKCLTRSLDVASEAILVDLDNVEELLGKPVQTELAAETGLDVALDALIDLANATQELSSRAESLLKEGERAHKLGLELSRETDEIRRDLEGAVRACSGPDRSLCAVIDSSGIRLDLRIERLLQDDRLLRLRNASRENLTEAGRQARGEYLHVPHHISRTTLDARNQMRREINAARARIVDQTRSVETNNFELSKQLDSARSITDYAVPHVIAFERIRWIVGIVLIVALGISSHMEMLICRPLYDPNYHTMETILETRAFLRRRLTVPLKELFEKCRNNEAAYPAFGLENVIKLEHLTAHWTWPGLSSIISNIKINLKGLQILTPNLQQHLQDLLYACSLNLTAHRTTIQGSILNKDLNTMSVQLDNIFRQLHDRNIARELQSIGIAMRDLTLRRVKPLMKLQDDLVYHLAVLELQIQPLLRQVNQSISHLRTIQYYIDHQGDKIAQLKIKSYVDRLANYLDQWRAHVLSETGTGVFRCRPLWDVLDGLRHLLCGHILSPLNGFWFATFICTVVMIASTPTAHVLSLVYKKLHFAQDVILLPTRTESIDTTESWQTPESPPLPPQNDW
ncbi:Prominin-1 [Ooceraea biroi]|uniref:Prominin-1 n=1 Tax=Ooceraea biroi TaxID=2015173 RepID=A0A026VYZ0_OOCBI|nr:Prominin-1 [Ooceraea biroi]